MQVLPPEEVESEQEKYLIDFVDNKRKNNIKLINDLEPDDVDDKFDPDEWKKNKIRHIKDKIKNRNKKDNEYIQNKLEKLANKDEEYM